MKTLYLDCFSGISGDMTLGALIDAGLDYDGWLAQVALLGLTGYDISRTKVFRSGLSATKLSITVTGSQPARHLSDIRGIITGSNISQKAKKTALTIFDRLGKAEAEAHGVPIEHVHFHEVGAVDSIIDITGTAIALDMLGIERIVCSPPNLGSGVVKFSHGSFPVPAPATAILLKGFPCYQSETRAELTTPTGAAILTALSDDFGPMPLMRVESVGAGAGDREFPGIPNVLRVFIGDSDTGLDEDTVSIIETNIDDMDPRIYEYVIERLLSAGALDVWLTPVIMKKSRPAVTLSVICESASVSAAVDIILRETTTFGVRIHDARRHKLGRAFREVTTPGGVIHIKDGSLGGVVIKSVPEYEDVKAESLRTGRGFREIIEELTGAE